MEARILTVGRVMAGPNVDQALCTLRASDLEYVQGTPGAREAMDERILVESRLYGCNLFCYRRFRAVGELLDIYRALCCETEHVKTGGRSYRKRRMILQR